METTEKSNKACFPIACGGITVILVCLWCVFIFTFNTVCGSKCELWYNFLLKAFSHLAFLAMVAGGIFITYKTYLAYFHEKCRRTEYLNKLNLERIQKEKYSAKQNTINQNEELEKLIKKAVKSVFDENQKAYESTLKNLKENVCLYNETKKIIENISDKETNTKE